MMSIHRVASALVWAMLGVAALAGASATAATLTVFNDRATFLAATGATSATGPLPAAGVLGSTTTVGTITYTAIAPSANLFFFDWSSRFTGIELALGGLSENLDLQPAAPVAALGFNFVEPQNDPNVNDPFIDSTFSVGLFNGVVPVGAFAFNAPNDTAAFVGVSSDVLFNRVEIREIVGSAENEFFGEIFTSPTLARAVPEPSTVPLFGLAALVVLAVARRRAR